MAVWLEASRDVASLLGFKDHPFRRATNGTHGMGKGRHGKGGADLVVEVPEGTVVRGAPGSPTGDLHFGDLAKVDLRLFANLGGNRDLVAKYPWMRGSRSVTRVSSSCKPCNPPRTWVTTSAAPSPAS